MINTSTRGREDIELHLRSGFVCAEAAELSTPVEALCGEMAMGNYKNPLTKHANPNVSSFIDDAIDSIGWNTSSYLLESSDPYSWHSCS